jgi:hypothetical protein
LDFDFFEVFLVEGADATSQQQTQKESGELIN